jgi:transposase
MKRRLGPAAILRLDGGNASRIAKRVGRSEGTVKRWQREGIPRSAYDDVKKALARHASAAAKASKAKKVAKVEAPKKAPARHVEPKVKAAKVEPAKKPSVRVERVKAVRSKPKRQLFTPPPKPSRIYVPKRRFEKPVEATPFFQPSKLAPTARGPGIVPLTRREQKERAQQIAIIQQMVLHIKVMRHIHETRIQIPGLEYTHGQFRADRSLLSDMISNDDPRWLKFRNFADELGSSAQEARNAWFSPKALLVRAS